MLAVPKYLKIAIFIVLFTYIGVLALLFFFQHKLMFHPSRLDKNLKLNLPGSYAEDFLQLSDDVTVHYLIQKVRSPRGVILYFHGNAGCLDSWGEVAYELATKTNYDVWIVDYPGFGKSSEALPKNEKILLQMGLQLMSKIRETYPQLPLFLFGRSVGSGIAGTLARTEKIEGLILETPYTSLKDIARQYFPWVPSALVRFDLDNLRIGEAKYQFQTLIIHGTDDEVIPFQFGQNLANKLGPRCLFVAVHGGHHNDLTQSPEYWHQLVQFLK